MSALRDMAEAIADRDARDRQAVRGRAAAFDAWVDAFLDSLIVHTADPAAFAATMRRAYCRWLAAFEARP